jgi:hypothetical protein
LSTSTTPVSPGIDGAVVGSSGTEYAKTCEADLQSLTLCCADEALPLGPDKAL